MKSHRRGAAVLMVLLLSAGCQAIEPRAHQMYTHLMAKNGDLFDQEGVRRFVPASRGEVEKALSRALSEQHAFIDGANLDFAPPPADSKKTDPELQTNIHVNVVRKESTKQDGTKVATVVLSNWYRLVAVRIEPVENGCEVTTCIYAEKSGNAQRASALLDRINDNLAVTGPREPLRRRGRSKAARLARKCNDLQLRAPRGSIEREAKESARTRSVAPPRKGCSDVLSAVARERRFCRRGLVSRDNLAGPGAGAASAACTLAESLSAENASFAGLAIPIGSRAWRPRAGPCRRCAWPTARTSGRRVALASRQRAWRLGPSRRGPALASTLWQWRSGARAAWITFRPRPAAAWKHLRPRRHGAGDQPG